MNRYDLAAGAIIVVLVAAVTSGIQAVIGVFGPWTIPSGLVAGTIGVAIGRLLARWLAR